MSDNKSQNSMMTLVMQKKKRSFKERAASPVGRTNKIIEVIDEDGRSEVNKSKASLGNSVCIRKNDVSVIKKISGSSVSNK